MKADRILDALSIRQGGGVFQSGPNKYAVRSQKKPRLTYSVGIKNGIPYCACRDFELHGQPCKHIMSSGGYPATAAILSFRWANDLEELEIARDLHTEALKALPEVLRAVARSEYKAAYNRLSEGAAKAA